MDHGHAPKMGVIPVILFLDVDGVLNDNWHGSESASPAPAVEASPLEEGRLRCLAEICRRLSEERRYEPRIVFSTMWRTHPDLLGRLLDALGGTPCAGGRSLRTFVYGGDGEDDGSRDGLEDAVTPSMGCSGRYPEERATQINGWLTRHTSAGRRRPLYLALDDLNLCFDSVGRHNPSFDAVHLLHTVDEGGAGGGADVGLTPSRVEEAMAKIRSQDERRDGRAGFSPDDWAMLRRSGMPLSVLSTPTCPPWIRDAAEKWLERERKKQCAENEGRKRRCIIL